MLSELSPAAVPASNLHAPLAPFIPPGPSFPSYLYTSHTVEMEIHTAAITASPDLVFAIQEGTWGKDLFNVDCDAHAPSDWSVQFGVFGYGPCCSGADFCGGDATHCDPN